MTVIHSLSGAVDTERHAQQEARYFSAVATAPCAGDASGTSRYALLPGIGRGTIRVTRLQGSLRMIRYDLVFDDDHRIDYDFPGDRFELELCVEGRMRVSEQGAGSTDLHSRCVSLTPARPTMGSVVHRAGEPYRAISVTGQRQDLGPYLGSLDPSALESALASLSPPAANELYRGTGTELRPAINPLEQAFTSEESTVGGTLLLESRLMASLAHVFDAITTPTLSGRNPVGDLEAFEREALNRVPSILWNLRHDLPTVPEIARMLPMSPKKMTRGFNALYGASILEYHRGKCLERAAELLVDTTWTVERIAHEAGYSTSSNFVYAFRRQQGHTPAQYRRTYT